MNSFLFHRKTAQHALELALKDPKSSPGKKIRSGPLATDVELLERCNEYLQHGREADLQRIKELTQKLNIVSTLVVDELTLIPTD